MAWHVSAGSKSVHHGLSYLVLAGVSVFVHYSLPYILGMYRLHRSVPPCANGRFDFPCNYLLWRYRYDHGCQLPSAAMLFFLIYEISLVTRRTLVRRPGLA